MDPRVSEDKVPAYDIIEAKIRQIDNTVIIFRIFYMLDTFIFKFQFLKKDTMCIVELPKKLLLDVKSGDVESERRLTDILISSIESSDCWKKVES
ncbi:MAG: hypothetical protein C4538_06185 [Nitrospiraceae bacterium]|nr:MAG: hypothetical protein C4538_06185 [Nitrospiraceae bacterium]